MTRKTIHLIAAARPNFMKIAPLYHALKKRHWAVPEIVHTGQHYDVNMSDAFFRDLMLPEPHHHLGIGSGSHAEQTGRVMMAYEKLLVERRPAMVVVVGDVNSTAACTLAAVKMNGNRPLVAHLEAGLRSFDRTMPEEINRIVTDLIADILWTPSPDGDENLLKEGVAAQKIERVGNIMIDSLEMLRARIERENALPKYAVEKSSYGLVTLHRPANVDDKKTLKLLCAALVRVSNDLPLVFPVHPRTCKNLEKYELLETLRRAPGLHLDEPIGYVTFMNLVFNCRLVITDSGGIQEESTYLGIPCLTLRPNTERPFNITEGTNRLCTVADLQTSVKDILAAKGEGARKPELWDGKTAERVADSIQRRLGI
jgi:UDP-N-acetylglucosamine 2-epimerase (non-hydrolysing)